jgi:dolichol-phosphate mannosyltransferase
MQSATRQTVLANSDVSTSAESTCAVDSISIIVPLYNERDGLAQLCERMIEFHSSLDEKISCEFLLIDDGSSDGTADLLCEFLVNRDNCRIIRHITNQGITAAIRTGLLHAESESVVSIDSDGSYDLNLLKEMLPRFTSDIDVIVASPYHPQGRVDNVSAWRISLSKCASRIYRTIFRQKLHCYTSSFRVYRRQRCIGINTRDTGFVGIAEFLWEADIAGCKIIEYPAILRPRRIGNSKMNLVRVMLGHLQLMGRITVSRLLWQTRMTSAIAPGQSETS